MNSVKNNYQANYANALGTAVIGGAAWGAGQYIFNKKPFMDSNSNIKDSFIKEMEDGLKAIEDKATFKNIELQQNIEKEIDALKSIDEIKQYVKKHEKDFMRISESDIKLLDEEFSKLTLEDGKNMAKGIFEKDGKYREFYNKTLESCYDDAGKQLVHDAKKISESKFNVVKKLVNKHRRNNALIAAGLFTGICATTCCLFEFFLSRRKNK